MSSTVQPVDEFLPTGRLAALGFQHVLVMYAGLVAMPLIVGRALNLTPEQVAMLLSADLFCCGIVTQIQSFGATQVQVLPCQLNPYAEKPTEHCPSC